MITLALTGDVMLGRQVNKALRITSPEQPWGDVLPLLLSADLRIVNLECAITDHEQPWARTPKVFHFRADPSAVEVLQAARVNGCSLANNHTLDFEQRGLLDTLRYLKVADIRYAGAGRRREQAAQPALLAARSADRTSRVALLAFTNNEPLFAAGPDRPGTNYLPVSLEPDVLRRVEAAVTAAREAGAETVVFSNHWGPNMVQRPSTLFRRFARAVLDRGRTSTMGTARISSRGWRSTAANRSCTTPATSSTITWSIQGCGMTGPSCSRSPWKGANFGAWSFPRLPYPTHEYSLPREANRKLSLTEWSAFPARWEPCSFGRYILGHAREG
jgi:Bacterial capsule synthesis protein PGA_cap